MTEEETVPRRCGGTGGGYDFNNPFVAMDVLSSWILYQQVCLP